MALLTILMPVYNASRFIKEAVGSLLNQSFRDFELWILDDASTDESISIVKRIQDSRIRFFSNEKNLGRVLTVNRFIKNVSTPYFTVTDADDVSHSQRLENQIDFLNRNPDFMMCGTSFFVMDEEEYLVRTIKLLSDVDELREASLHQSQFLGPSTVMRKSVIDEFPEFYRIYIDDHFADADLSCQILDRFKATNIIEPLYYYRIVSDSITRKMISVRSLNLHLLVGFLSKQRREQGKDCLQRNATSEADEFMKDIQKKYDNDPSFFFRHQAFFHLYWGVTDLAFHNGWKALKSRPFYFKNFMGFPLIIFRIGLSLLTRRVKMRIN